MHISSLKEHLDAGHLVTEVELRSIIDQAARASDALSQNEHDRFARCTALLIEAMSCLEAQSVKSNP